MKIFLKYNDYYQHGEKFEIIIHKGNTPPVHLKVTEISFNNAIKNLNAELIKEDKFPATRLMKLYQIK